MNIVNKVTLRQLRLNKKRTLVTILGVIISVAMITAVATLAFSTMDLMQRVTIAQNGNWHVAYKDVNIEQFRAVENDASTQTAFLSQNLGYAKIDGAKNITKPYLFVRAFDDAGFSGMPVHVTEGRLPKNENELLLPEHAKKATEKGFSVGESLSLLVGTRIGMDNDKPLWQGTRLATDDNGNVTERLEGAAAHTYTIVGFYERPDWEPAWAAGYSALTATSAKALTAGQTADAYVALKTVDRGLYGHAQEVCAANGIASPQFNNALLRYYGVLQNDELQNIFVTFCSIIMAIIMVGSVSLIYNAFAISVSERSRHLGMLSSVGATKKQKRNSVFFEGAAIGAVSIPLGFGAGVLGIYVTFLILNNILSGTPLADEGFQVVIKPMVVIISVAVSALTIFISTYLPARRASKVSPIDAIRQTGDVKLSKKSVKTSRLTRKLFGIEAEIGLKNLKRSKRRYKATIFSLAISIILFLTVSTFTGLLQQSLMLTSDGVNFDISVSQYGVGDPGPLFEQILAQDHITGYSRITSFDAHADVDAALVPSHLKNSPKYSELLNADGTYPYMVSLFVLDDASLAAYAKSAGIDLERLNAQNGPAAIMINTVTFKDNAESKYRKVESMRIKPGESFTLVSQAEGGERTMGDVTVAALTGEAPIGVIPYGTDSGLTNLVMSQNSFALLSRNGAVPYKEVNHKLNLQSDDPVKLEEDISALTDVSGLSRVNVFNAFTARQQEQQIVSMTSLFVYGFIVLITLICIANIFNTISTSIALRRREFAMLKSVGMTPSGFNKMIRYESVFYGLKALLYGLPVSFILMWLLYRSLGGSFEFPFPVPWLSIVLAVVLVFVIVGATMLYSTRKTKKENIVDALKQENI